MRPLPDIEDKKLNSVAIWGLFLKLTPDEYGNGSYRHLSEILKVPTTTLRRWMTTPDPVTGKTWVDQRNEIWAETVNKITTKIAKTQLEIQMDLIDDTSTRVKKLDEKIDEFLDNDQLVINEENFEKLLKVSEMMKQNIAKLAGVIKSGGNSGPTFKLDIPMKFVTIEGRKWIRNKINNPMHETIEADFEEISDEDTMKDKQKRIGNNENSNN